jgi:hypothetical protein
VSSLITKNNETLELPLRDMEEGFLHSLYIIPNLYIIAPYLSFGSTAIDICKYFHIELNLPKETYGKHVGGYRWAECMYT